MKLRGKVMVVTGGGSGIGRELVRALLARGARVAAVDLRPEGLDTLAAELQAGERLSCHTLNVADREAVAALPAAVVAAHGAVDGIINNAGIIHRFAHVRALDFATMDRVIQVNLYGVLHMVSAFLPLLLERPEAHVVNVSSMGGFMPFPGQTVYGASKAGVKLLTEGLYAELLDTQVRVSVVMPGAVATSISDNSGVAQPGTAAADASSSALAPLPAQEAAKIILDGVERDRLHILVGRDARFLHLASRFAFAPVVRMLSRKIGKMLPIER